MVLDKSQKILLELAKEVIRARKELKELEIKGKLFIEALREHEKTVRLAIENQTKQANYVIDALKTYIENTSDDRLKEQALKMLVEYSSRSIKELGNMAENAFKSLPDVPKYKQLK